jgi:hypothetical protein
MKARSRWSAADGSRWKRRRETVVGFLHALLQGTGDAFRGVKTDLAILFGALSIIGGMTFITHSHPGCHYHDRQMANIASYMQTGMLNWVLLTGSPRRPLSVTCGLTTDVPTNTTGTEVVDSGYSRQVPAFSAATIVGGLGTSVSTGSMTFGPFNSGHTIHGIVLFDDQSNVLFFATLTKTVNPGDSIAMSPGALTATLV